MVKNKFVSFVMALIVTSAVLVKPVYANDDASKPVEINADNLSVDQQKQIATFSGNVEARQGSILMTSKKMIVHYRSKKDRPKTTPQANAVSRIEVIGDVFLTTDEETASGLEGEYNVDTKVITLIGNVVLTQGQNVVKGDKLVYNLQTGKSKLTSKPNPQTGNKRVRGVFIPE